MCSLLHIGGVKFKLLSIILLYFCLTLIHITKADINEDGGEKAYAVIVDCGSSGTRASIFVWNSSLSYEETLHNLDNLRTKDGQPLTIKKSPGLSSLKDNPEEASEYMKPIVDFILENIPKNAHKSTGVYMMGTAGMRLLENEDRASISKDIMKDFRYVFAEFARVNTNVIPGSYEGMYEWITINSRLKKLVRDQSEEVQTYGLIEMGGASIQVTYQLEPEVQSEIIRSLSSQPSALMAFQKGIVEPQFSRKSKKHNYQLFSTSFLGFGSNSVRELYVNLLIRDYLKLNSVTEAQLLPRRSFGLKPKRIIVQDPCMPTMAVKEVVRPVSMARKLDGPLELAKDEVPEFIVRLHGDGDYMKCRFLLSKLLDFAKNERYNCQPGKQCPMSLLGVSFMPGSKIKFLGLGELYYTNKEIFEADGLYDQKRIGQLTRRICETSLAELVATYREVANRDHNRVRLQCFKAVWIEVFLNSVLGFGDSNKFILETKAKINGDNIDWTLGAAIDKSLAIELAIEENKSVEI